MSSPGLPRLDVEVGRRRTERRLAMASTLLALLLVDHLLAAGAVDVWLRVGCGLLLAGTLLLGFHRAGWLGERRIERLVWLSDGRWLLFDERGRSREAELAPDTRFGPGCAWLRWRVAAPHTMLLLPGDLAPDELRRLLVRLRIDRQGQGSANTHLSDSMSRLP